MALRKILPLFAATTLLSLSAHAAVVINEFGPAPSPGPGREWVELYNNGNAPVDISGYQIRAATSGVPGVKATVPAGTTLAAGEFWVICQKLDDNSNGVANCDQSDLSANALGNASGNPAHIVLLTDADEDVLDTVVYGGTTNSQQWLDDNMIVAVSLAPKPTSNSSLARKQDGVDTNLSGDDFELIAAAATTPGARNKPAAGSSSSSSSGGSSTSSSSGGSSTSSSSSGGSSTSSSSSGGSGTSSTSSGSSGASGSSSGGSGASGPVASDGEAFEGGDNSHLDGGDGGCSSASSAGSPLGALLALGALLIGRRRHRAS